MRAEAEGSEGFRGGSASRLKSWVQSNPLQLPEQRSAWSSRAPGSSFPKSAGRSSTASCVRTGRPAHSKAVEADERPARFRAGRASWRNIRTIRWRIHRLRARPREHVMSVSVHAWWFFLCTVAVLNIVAWSQRQPSLISFPFRRVSHSGDHDQRDDDNRARLSRAPVTGLCRSIRARPSP